jgi:hypothetical protein
MCISVSFITDERGTLLSRFGRPPAKNYDVGIADEVEQVVLTGVLQGVGHDEVDLHESLQGGNSVELTEFDGVGVVAEAAGDKRRLRWR